MTNVIQARLLGRPEIVGASGPLAFGSRKALLLACYVLMSRASHPRTQLATLLWGADSPRHALGSLRVALTKLPAAVLEQLEVTRETIGARAGYALDVEEFAQQCAAGDARHAERAVALYRGELLEGADRDMAPEFGDWLLAERNRLRQLAHDAHVRLAQSLHAQGERERARAVADAWLRNDPACEAMHRLLMTWSGPDQALAQYEVYRRARAVAHGAPPSESMAGFVERLRRGAEGPRDAPQRLTAATSFFGRTEELAELRALLADPGCRLLTIHGFGGVGKTRLATSLAQDAAAVFPGGTFVVGLEGLQSPELFAQTVARACGLQPAGAASPADLVATFLRDRIALVVLDNLEHLIDPAATAAPQSIEGQIAALLRATGAGVKILATSREPLRLQEEWVFPLEGLSHPRVSEGSGNAERHASVQFFAQRARQAYAGFSLPAELSSVAQICMTLEGLPLGLELAASWVRSVPCAEIAASLAERASELRNRHLNRAARHDTLGAVVAYSWERLTPEQRDALSGLGALLGSFSREAADQVAQSSVRTLTALSEKSLLQRAGDGRWRLHEVVRQYAWEQPDLPARARPGRQAAVLRRRDTFYLEYLRLARAQLDGAAEPETLSAIEQELPNIRAAWRSAARAGLLEALDAAADGWFEFLDSRNYSAEGIAAATLWLEAALRAGRQASAQRARIHLAHCQQMSADLAASLATLDTAVAALEKLDSPADLAHACTERALTLSHLGRLQDAEAGARLAMALAEKLADPLALARACTVLGIVVVRAGKPEEARDLGRRALALVAGSGKPSIVARLHNNLALADNHLGDYRAAEAGYQSAFDAWSTMRMTRFMGLAMHNLGVVAERMGDHALALERYRTAFDMFTRVGDRKMVSINLMSTGDALIRIGRPDEALAPLGEALRIAERDLHGLPVPYTQVMLAHAAVARGKPLEGADALSRAFESAEKNNYADVLAEAVVGTARLLVAHAPRERHEALALLAAILELPNASARVRDDARAILAAHPGAPAHPAGRAVTLADLVARARACLGSMLEPAAVEGA
jgi:predicted ATPase/DNA-binding SARP family transcriptional activator